MEQDSSGIDTLSIWKYSIPSTGLLFSIIGSWWILRKHRWPIKRNAFGRLLRTLIIIDLCFSIAGMIAISIQQNSEQTSKQCQSIAFLCFLYQFLSMLEPFFLSLFIFMSLNVGLIPLYIVKFEGSIENVNWAALVMMAFFPACIAFLGLASANIRFYIELIIMPFLRLLSISIMFLSCTWTWYTLKVQQLDREDHLSRRTFLTNEIYKHQASLIMMRLSGSLALISTLLLVSQLSFGLSLIFTDSLAKSFEEFPQFLRVLYVMNQLITCSNAGILAVGIYLSTRKPKSIHNSQQVPAHAILRNPNQVNPVAKTVRFDLADTVRESSESADPNSDIMDHIAVNGVDRTISTIRVSGSTSIDTTGTSVYTDDLEVQDTGVVQNYLQHYVIQPVVFIQFCIVAYWAQLITKFNRTP